MSSVLAAPADVAAGRSEQAASSAPLTRAPDASRQQPAHPEPSAALASLADRLAHQYGLETPLVRALVHVASSFQLDGRDDSVGGLGRMWARPSQVEGRGEAAVSSGEEAEARLREGLGQLRHLVARYGRLGPAVVAFAAGEGATESDGGGVMSARTLRRVHQVLSEYLLAKGVLPYSPQAERLLGLALTPEMAGPFGGSPLGSGLDRAMLLSVQYGDPPPDVSQPSKLDTPVGRRSLEATQRKATASRLSSRLDRSSKTLLQSRIYRPSAPARQAADPSADRFGDGQR